MLERWMTPGLFAGTDAVEEYTFMQTPGAREKIRDHQKNFIREEDFRWLKEHGVDAVRIPVGYWIFEGDAPYVSAIGRLDWAFRMAEKYDLQVLRFFMLSAHYRSPLNFSAELMEAAANSLERIRTAVATLQFKAQNAEDSELTEQEKELLAQAAGFEAKFDQAMDDDFNTADAIAAIFELVKFANTCGDAEHTKAFWEALKEKITTLSDVCGLIVEKKEELLDADVEALIEERQAARKAKNFARADEIRQQLLDMGIVLEDTREGVKWKRA